MVKFTMLNSMASADFAESLDIQQALGIEVLDLKDSIFGKPIADLTVSEARQAAEMIAARGLSVYCLSTQLFHEPADKGKDAFVRNDLKGVDRAIAIADILQPVCIRLLPAIVRPERPGGHVEQVRKHFPWLPGLYREAVDRIAGAGYRAVMENEYGSLLASPEEILEFFELVDRPGKLHLTYDVQNLWQMGTYPSLEAYRTLRPLISYLHVKGGQEDPVSKKLKWKSSLEDATWPIADIVREAIRDGCSPVICLNPSHGELRDGYDYRNLERRDFVYLRGVASSI